MSAPYRPELPPRPPRIAALPLDDRGYPVPWFVAWINGKPEFRAMEAQKIITATKQRRCWVCGQPTRGDEAFTIGPMCIINRISAEPPSHLECATYSVQACPFLTKPHMVRRENDMPCGTTDGAGVMIKRNPGAACVWVTSKYELVPDPAKNGFLFSIGDPTAWTWWTEGRAATRAEVEESIESGVPLLLKDVAADDHEARAVFFGMYKKALAYLPA